MTSDLVHPALLVRDALARYDRAPDTGIFDSSNSLMPGVGEQFPYSQPLPKIPWLEAALGIPIEMNGGQLWVREAERRPEEILEEHAGFANNPWLELYRSYLVTLEEMVGERFPVSANTLFRGPSDLTAAVLGVAESCIGWLETPELMKRLLRLGADANLAFINAGREIVRPRFGGFMCSYGVLAPGPVVRVQADHSSLLSPEVYRTQILPFDREVVAAAASSVFHIHNNGLHVAPHLAALPELDVVEITVDPYPAGERREYEIDAVNRLLESKPVILDVNFPDADEAERFFAATDHPGLFLNARFSPDTFSRLPADYPGREVWVLA